MPDPRTRAVPDSFPLTASVGDILAGYWKGEMWLTLNRPRQFSPASAASILCKRSSTPGRRPGRVCRCLLSAHQLTFSPLFHPSPPPMSQAKLFAYPLFFPLCKASYYPTEHFALRQTSILSRVSSSSIPLHTHLLISYYRISRYPPRRTRPASSCC